jgi:class 3 adenylate cyclase
VQFDVVPENARMAVAFLDLKGSTHLVGTLDDEQLRDVLERWFSTVCSIFRAYGASVRNRPGDCVVAIWQESLGRPADRALLAVHRARSASLRLGIGTHTGVHFDRAQLLADFQIEHHATDLPSVFGRAPWLAARVQARDEQGHIVATREFIAALTIPSRWSEEDAEPLYQFGSQWKVRRLESVGTQTRSTSRRELFAFHALEAEAAEKAGTPSELLGHAEQAAAAVEGRWDPEREDHVSRLTLLRIDALTSLGRLDEAERHARDLVGRAETRSTDKGKACLSLAEIWRLRGSSTEESDAIRRALDRLSDDSPSVDRAVGLFFLGYALLRSGDRPRGTESWRASRRQFTIVASSPLSSQLDQGICELHLGILSAQVFGEHAEATSHLARALKAFTDVGHLRYQRNTLNTLGTVAMERGDDSSAESYFSRALALARAVDDRSLAATVLRNLAALWHQRCDSRSGPDDVRAVEIARIYYQEAKDIFTALGYHQAATECERFADELLSRLDRARPDDSAPSATAPGSPHPLVQRREPPLGPDVPPRGLDPFSRGRWWHERGRRYEAAGRYDIALKCFVEAVNCKLQVADRNGLATSYHMVGVTYARLGDPTNARSFMLKSLEIDAAEGDLDGVKRSLRDLATMLRDTDRPLEAAMTLAVYYPLIEWEKAPDGGRWRQVVAACDVLQGSYGPPIQQALRTFFQTRRRAGV